MLTLEFDVTGMVCDGCSTAVRTLVLAQTGSTSATVDHGAGTACITGDATMTLAAVRSAIRDGGFGVRASAILDVLATTAPATPAPADPGIDRARPPVRPACDPCAR